MQGDNLVALKALLPYYAGQVKCIYIDPPYNTGNESWVYNDNVNSPVISEWLGKVVGKEGETLDRHDRWLCMMYPRLALFRQFLREDGAIFISIDDYEYSRLKLMMNELFGETNHVATFIWKRRTSPDSRNLNGISGDHEYVLCYQRANGFRVLGQSKDLSKYNNPDNDLRGSWMSDNLTGLANAVERPNLHYDLVHPDTNERFKPHPSRGWIYGRERMTELIQDNRILWPRKKGGRPRLKRYVSDMQTPTTGFSTVLDAPGNVVATKELSELMGPKAFTFPKPSHLIALLIEQATGPNELVLDSFAGSGTTGEAVLHLNKKDGGNRRFILIEVESSVARDVTIERVRRVAKGFTMVNALKVSAAVSDSANWASLCLTRTERFERQLASPNLRAMFILARRVNPSRASVLKSLPFSVHAAVSASIYFITVFSMTRARMAVMFSRARCSRSCRRSMGKRSSTAPAVYLEKIAYRRSGSSFGRHPMRSK